MNTHINTGVADYESASTDLADLQYLGISYVRDGYNTANESVYTALGQAGIKFDFETYDGGSITTADLQSEIAAYNQLNATAPGMVAELEGPNEINQWPITYNGQTSLDSAVAFQQDLYSLAHGDSSLPGVQVYYFTGYGMGGNAQGPNPATTPGLADFDTAHPYPQNGLPPLEGVANTSSALNPLRSDALTNETPPTGPAVYTETGYNMNSDASGATGAAIGDVEILLDDAQQGIAKTYLYELEEEAAGSGDGTSGGLGLFNGTAPTAAATAIHDLTTILGSSGTSSSTASGISYSVSNLPSSTGHAMEFTGANGTSYIAIWNETSPLGQAPTPTNITVNLGASASVSVYDPIQSTNAIQTLSSVSSIALSLSDDPLILQVKGPTTVSNAPPSPNDTVVKAGSTAAITDASGNVWTITGGAQVAVNGVTDALTSNVTEIAYVNGAIWQENTASNWYSETQPNDSWTGPTTVSPLSVKASANDTVVKAGSTAAITDASGNAWTITSGGQVAVNGVTDAVTSNVIELAYVNGAIWQENTASNWYSETQPNDSWTGPTTVSPLPVKASANDTVVKAGSTAAITDASGNAWTITSGGQVAVNGVTDALTSNVTELAYVNGAIWQENTSSNWYSETQPNDSWSGPTTVSPLPANASANDTEILAGSTAAITDASGNAWTITSGGQVAVNGVTDSLTSNVTTLAYVNGTIWQENTSKNWYGETKPNDSWSAATTTSPLVVAVAASQSSVTVTLSSATINAASGNHLFFISGHADSFNLAGGVETITDSGTGGNTFKLPAAGSGSAVFNAAVLTDADVFDLTAALKGTSWTGSASTLSSYLHSAEVSGNAELLVSATATTKATGTLLATFDSSNATLTTMLAHAIT
nr:hypothetical protein [uncultured Rhodopila sp.]